MCRLSPGRRAVELFIQKELKDYGFRNGVPQPENRLGGIKYLNERSEQLHPEYILKTRHYCINDLKFEVVIKMVSP